MEKTNNEEFGIEQIFGVPPKEEDDLEVIEVSKGTTYIINIDGYIEAPDAYRKILKTLRETTVDDTVIFKIACYGGILDSAILIGQAILDSKATVIADITVAASAATIIALYCDEIIVNPFSTFMVHNFSGQNQGKGQELRAKSEFDDHYFKKLTNFIYQGFMTEEELNAMRDDKDYWFDGDETKARLKNWVPIKQRG